jgi:flagellar hook protein FlgE
MSVFDSLFTAVSGLSAQSQALGMVSNNIANVSTVGYKETEAQFKSLVTQQNGSTLYSPGGVSVVQNQLVNFQGILQQESQATNLALSGNGMFIVKQGTAATSPIVYTRNGSFTEDTNGNLTNSSGFTLLGYKLDSSGNIIGPTTNTSSLVPINVAFPGGLASATTQASLAASLNSSQLVDGNTDFSEPITIFDSLGDAHTLNVNFSKAPSAAATATGTSDLSAQTAAFSGTGNFTISLNGGAATTITVGGDTVTQVLDQLNAIAGVTASLNSAGQITIEGTDTPGDTVALVDGAGANAGGLADLGLTAGTSTAPAALTAMTGALPNAQNDNGWWNVTFTSDTGTLATGSINFNGNGTLNATPDPQGNVNVALGPAGGINWGNGAALQSLNFDLAQMTTAAGSYNVSATNQNGTALGFATGVSVGQDGKVSVQFTNGLSRDVYQLSIANFANPNGLTQLTGNVYQTSNTSGTPTLQVAQTGGTGTVEGGELEESNVDIAAEFSHMIVTQQAFTANSKVISTADQMLASLLAIQTG